MNRYRPILDWIDSQQLEMTELLRGWAGINTGTFNPAGLATLGELIAAEFGQFSETTSLLEAGTFETIDAHGHPHARPLGRNLHVVHRPSAPLQVLLAIHMDTVYGVESPFQTVDQLDADTLRGPGVADAKGGIVILLFALRALERYVTATGKQSLGWEVVINSDEEIGSPGSIHLFQEVAQRVHLGLLFEPSLPDGKLVSSRKGTGNLSIVGHGRAAHSGRDFHHGINAVVAAAEVSTQLHRLTGQWEGMTLNVARIDGGGPSNVVPPVSVIRLNIRYAEQEHEAEILDTIGNILEGVTSHTGVRFDLHGHFAAPPKRFDAATEKMLMQLHECGREVGCSIDWAASGGACDGNRLAAFGVPNVDSLGVRGGQIHSHEEFVVLESLRERAKLTALYLMQLLDETISPPLPHLPSRVE
ncbi:hydrolase [Planctomicrobium sp. SH661]|uniref:hydrolase n=1 Tax=Planctomicrobium sp. SH661 TaxID=3448124 RepID=UPI003F5BABCB